MQEFGERLIPVRYEDIPPLFRRALLDTEDKRFFEHSGIVDGCHIRGRGISLFHNHLLRTCNRAGIGGGGENVTGAEARC